MSSRCFTDAGLMLVCWDLAGRCVDVNKVYVDFPIMHILLASPFVLFH
jgi:hypothetical protein